MTDTHRAIDSAAAPVAGASVNHNGMAEAGRAHMQLHHSEDGRYRWFGDDGSDTEVSGRTPAEAIRLATKAWGGTEWDFRLDPAAPVGSGMTIDANHVTHLTVETVRYDGTAECEQCGRPISYITGTHPVPTHCIRCADEIAYREHATFASAGDGRREVR